MWTFSADVERPLPLWRPERDDPDAVLAFTTRRGGVSDAPFDTLNLGRSTADRPEAVAENRARALRAATLDPARLATAGQVHGARVVEARTPGHVEACDALVTCVPGLVLAVTSADCLPILLVAPGAVAAAHAGWRGTAAGIPRATLEGLRAAAGTAPDRVRVAFGPCIRGCCYEVGDEVALQFPEAARQRANGRWKLDLPSAARLQLVEAGLSPDAIADTGACTACDPDLYFSHRRDAGRTGRHWGLVALRG
jgi:YfiH family protein